MSRGPHSQQVNGAGDRLPELEPTAGQPVSGPGTAADGARNVRQQKARLRLSSVTPPDLGRLLDAWREANPAWRATGIELTHKARPRSDADAYDAPSSSPPGTSTPMLADRRLAVLAVALLAAASCRGPQELGPYQPPSEAVRDTERADELNAQAADLILTEPEEAEALLGEALTADLFHGPAHNNLGVIYLERDDLYEAAAEFEWARRLMPDHPDPEINLALTLRRGGRYAEAADASEAVYAEHPGSLPALQGWALSAVEARESITNLGEARESLATEANSHEWQRWIALQQLGPAASGE